MVMCRSVRKTFHSILPLPTQQWWPPGGMRKLHYNDWLELQQNAQMLNSPQRRRDCKRVCSNTKGCILSPTDGDIRTTFNYIYIYYFLLFTSAIPEDLHESVHQSASYSKDDRQNLQIHVSWIFYTVQPGLLALLHASWYLRTSIVTKW